MRKLAASEDVRGREACLLPIVTLDDARRAYEGHRRGEIGRGFRQADHLADALGLVLLELDQSKEDA